MSDREAFKEEIKRLALNAGFSLKQQPDGTMDLNPYVYAFADLVVRQAQAQAGDGEAVGVIDYAFMAGVALTEKGASLPHGTKLYTAPPAAVNQQLLELLKQAARYTRHSDYDWDIGFMRDVDTAIAAAQEQK